VADLRDSLQSVGQDLLVRRGDSAAVIGELASTLVERVGPSGSVEVRFCPAAGPEEEAEEKGVRQVGAIPSTLPNLTPPPTSRYPHYSYHHRHHHRRCLLLVGRGACGL
jgi:hypothetical protein